MTSATATDLPRGGEDALRESEQRLQLLIAHTPAAVAMFDREMRYLAVSRRFLSDYGLDDQHVLGRSHYEVFPEIPERWKEIHRRCLGGAVERCEEEPFLRADGTTNWVHWEIVPWRDTSGEVGGIVLFSEDITRSKRVEEMLRAREAQFEVLIEELHSGVAHIDASGKFALYNRRFLEMFGLSRDADVENVNSQNWSAWQVFDEGGRLLHVDEHPVRKATLTGKPVRNQLVGVRLPRDGELVWMLVSAEPLLREDGKIEQVICTYHDVTDRRRAEEALRLSQDALREANEHLLEADRRKDEFLSMLSHELRNPLAPIRNSTYILRHARTGSEQARRAQSVIERQTEHLTRLVDDLLDVTRIGRGKIQLRRQRVDLREVVVRAAEDFRITMQERGVDFRTAFPDAEVWADADATRVAQVIGNLLHNAGKFTQRGDEVLLSLRVVAGNVEIVVRDSGAGIEPALLPRVFEPFVQGERTLARTEGGLGLGLVLVKGVTELHGGKVSAESAGIGKGATFTLLLPGLVSRAAHAKSHGGVERPTHGRRILVVDDNADSADSLAEIVKLLGHSVDVAYDGPSALRKARESHPDVLLCDLGLPGMSGYEVAAALRAEGVNRMQLIAVSGYAQPDDVRRAIDSGFHAHLAKPLDPDEIERLLG